MLDPSLTIMTIDNLKNHVLVIVTKEKYFKVSVHFFFKILNRVEILEICRPQVVCTGLADTLDK